MRKCSNCGASGHTGKTMKCPVFRDAYNGKYGPHPSSPAYRPNSPPSPPPRPFDRPDHHPWASMCHKCKSSHAPGTVCHSEPIYEYFDNSDPIAQTLDTVSELIDHVPMSAKEAKRLTRITIDRLRKQKSAACH